MTLTTYLRTLKSIRQWLSDIVRDIRVEAEHCNPVRKAIYIYIYIYQRWLCRFEGIFTLQTLSITKTIKLVKNRKNRIRKTCTIESVQY